MTVAAIGVASIRSLADQQWGQFTSVQAKARDVADTELASAVAEGRISIVRAGVFEFPDSEQWSRFGDWAAEWLAARPNADIHHRRAHPDSLVSHAAAARLQDLGVIVPQGLELTAPGPVQIDDSSTRVWRGPIGTRGKDWTVVEGFPVTSPARTVEDLLTAGCDGSYLGTVIDDVLNRGDVAASTVRALCARVAARWGFEAGQGDALLNALLDAAAHQ